MALLEDKISALERTVLLAADKAEQMRQKLAEKNAELFSEVNGWIFCFATVLLICYLHVRIVPPLQRIKQLRAAAPLRTNLFTVALSRLDVNICVSDAVRGAAALSLVHQV